MEDIHVQLEVIYTLLGIIAVIGAICMFALKAVFMTKKNCKKETAECHTRICKKIDDVNTLIDGMEKKRNDVRKEQHKQDLWLAESLTNIASKVGAKIEPIPK